MFNTCQEKAKAFLSEENKAMLVEDPSHPPPGTPAGGRSATPSTPAGRALPLHHGAGSPGGGATRSPQSIQFGKYDINTWYSSPYPQEYAR